MIGDSLAHEPDSYHNKYKINWREEAKLLKEANIKCYAVKCLAWSDAKHFWRELANLTGILHLFSSCMIQIFSFICRWFLPGASTVQCHHRLHDCHIYSRVCATIARKLFRRGSHPRGRESDEKYETTVRHSHRQCAGCVGCARRPHCCWTGMSLNKNDHKPVACW